MRRNFRAVVAGALLIVVGCTSKPPQSNPDQAAPEKSMPDVVRRMIEAHGGMEPWRSAPSVRFTDRWDDAKPTSVAVEQGSRRVHMEVVGTGSRMAAWDGEPAWSTEWQGPPSRFMAQLTYYFLNLPWLTMDPGVKLAEPGTGRLWDDSTSYATVMMTFDPGVGDTPDDFYELYIHPDTHRLKACRYVVTYQALVPPGAKHTPEHMLVFDRHETVSGLVVPTRLTIYGMDRSVVARCSISDWSFDQPFDAAMVAMPPGAVVDTTTP